MRIYDAVPENLTIFHEFFRDWLLPVQLRHGARLIGRWQTDDDRVVAVWEYDDRDTYERIQRDVRADPDCHRAQAHRQTLPTLFTTRDEVFMHAAPQLDHPT
ncbi:NIPSNAP family protein [Nocardia pseudobrasiliensis]|uniref:NIPSNAP protein n=1 Tax=Nocardia pseudobrasiliensis TaxID=45979 RepID=A0A370IEA0_9NOCA|nr:NIPSNAP family protein [Nocardia pseudobrasiliensis]RDI69039.1 NIPSNAP protein [Nocardia pseudobrasiliensis]